MRVQNAQHARFRQQHFCEGGSLACYDITTPIDHSVLYADKNHSMNRTDVMCHVRIQTPGPILSRKVLETALEKLQQNAMEFLQEVNAHRLPAKSLVIRLIGKDREINKATDSSH